VGLICPAGHERVKRLIVTAETLRNSESIQNNILMYTQYNMLQDILLSDKYSDYYHMSK